MFWANYNKHYFGESIPKYFETNIGLLNSINNTTPSTSKYEHIKKESTQQKTKANKDEKISS